ncbi:hypothetical protein ACQXXB_07895 [Aeromonas veronii]|uniref:hypothetical protein n=1 Tax=Aeromonas veronii TaxID=654 RepID=UPI003D209904
MEKALLGDLFGITFSRPLETDNIIRLVEIIPELALKKASVDGGGLSKAIAAIFSEVVDFSEKLDSDESTLFLDVFERECSARMTGTIENEVEITDPSETMWKFYIRFKVSEPLGLDSSAINFFGKYLIKPAKNKSLKDDDTLILTSESSMTYREIMFESKKVEQALILGLAELGIGVAYPENLASEALLEKIKKEAESQFLKTHTKVYDSFYEMPLIHFSDKFGVVLFPEQSFPWDSKAEQDKEPVDITKFDEAFSKNYEKLKGLQIIDDKFKKIEIATSILTTSIFEDSLINKIILSMTVIEVLSNKESRSDEELKVLDYLAKVLHDRSDIDLNTKSSINQALESSRYQSISKSCKVLVKSLLGKKDANLFYNLYNYRSQLVHTGVLKNDRDEMLKIHNESYDLARRLLSAYLKLINESD